MVALMAMNVMGILTELSTPAGRADPYPLYAALHEIGEVIEFGPADVMVVGYDAIDAVLRDPGFRVSDDANFDRDLPAGESGLRPGRGLDPEPERAPAPADQEPDRTRVYRPASRRA